jgi:hypothetical protein
MTTNTLLKDVRTQHQVGRLAGQKTRSLRTMNSCQSCNRALESWISFNALTELMKILKSSASPVPQYKPL